MLSCTPLSSYHDMRRHGPCEFPPGPPVLEIPVYPVLDRTHSAAESARVVSKDEFPNLLVEFPNQRVQFSNPFPEFRKSSFESAGKVFLFPPATFTSLCVAHAMLESARQSFRF